MATPTKSTTAVDRAAFCAERLRVLADPTRLAVMELLHGGARLVSELQAALALEQSLLSHHLRVLRDAGLVTTTREGKGMRYALASDVALCDDAEKRSLHIGCCAIVFEDRTRLSTR